MLVIKIELHSAVDKSVREIGRMHITNDGTGTAELANYDGQIFRIPHEPSPFRGRFGKVDNYHRRALHVWNLVARMLTQMGYK